MDILIMLDRSLSLTTKATFSFQSRPRFPCLVTRERNVFVPKVMTTNAFTSRSNCTMRTSCSLTMPAIFETRGATAGTVGVDGTLLLLMTISSDDSVGVTWFYGCIKRI